MSTNNNPVIWDERDYKIRTALFVYLDWLDGQKDCAPKGEFSIIDMIFWLAKVKKMMGNKL